MSRCFIPLTPNQCILNVYFLRCDCTLARCNILQ